MGSPTTGDAPASPTLKKPATDVRSKFFTVIGIESRKETTSKHAATPPKRQLAANEWTHSGVHLSRQQQTIRLEETLKFDPYVSETLSPKRKHVEASPSDRPKKRISFDTKVKVVPIPMRDEYSHRVRSRLWSNALEIHENATRNSIEFAAEGWDWRSVMEDEYMFVDIETGELIHPIHCEAQQADS